MSVTPAACGPAREPVAITTDGDGVRVVTFDLAERRNTWGPDLEDAYYAALDDAERDPAVRAVVVTGAGPTFCPGMDPAVLGHTSGGGAYHRDRRPQTWTTRLRKPVIAAVNGACAGVGLVQALYCDRRVTCPEAKFSTAFARLGLPAEDGVAWVLTRLVGPSVAFDLLATARVVSGAEAVRLGLADQLSEPGQVVADAVAYARVLATTVSPAALAMIKAQVWQDAGVELEQARLRARHYLAVAKNHPDFAEGVAAFRERRAARFAPFEGIHL
ncbi:enoyl-CoA hydratase/carnithine racemase [Frankia sp. EI5c]|uniref:enoyl-CoA hydratase-related protein n=1 Tax=Frankia sp. EI5c TaxID=683316 RepID=UPI0007C402FC|nr:enoyl-CoA hydratase-related protein [Frankia sp. EI5c]OAA27438.1 enoyl-CoA hydratase/carnithine racemase [Frankia sp. EI5c]